jgi:iron complex outermembrane receptor protein
VKTSKKLKQAAAATGATRTAKAGWAVFLMATAGVATAAPAEGDAKAEEEVETVVVTGVRAAIESAIALKKEADTIVEAVSAEDIGKLPDNSIAESIARLPGLTAQRLDGRAQNISIRGMAGDFSTTLLNGRQQVSSGDNRSVEFDQFPSELLSGVVVYKTSDATIVGTGLSGTVDLRTVRPLEYGRSAMVVNVRGEKNSQGKLNAGSDDVGYRASASYINQFADDTVGIALGIATISSPGQANQWEAWGYPDGPAGNKVIGGAKPFVASNELKRTGIIGTLEYKPNDNYSSTLDLYYSKFDNDQIKRGIELPLWWSAAQLQPGYTASNGLVTQGTFNGVKGVINNHKNIRSAKVTALGWKNEWTNDSWTTVADLSYSKVDRKDSLIESNAGTSRGGGNGPFDNLGFSMSGTQGATFSSTLDYSNPASIFLTSPQGWGSPPGGQDGYVNYPDAKDELIQFRLSAKKALDSAINSVEVGVDYTDRSKNLDVNEFFLSVKRGSVGASVPVPSQYLLRPTRLDFIGIAGMISYDPEALIKGGVYDLVRNTNGDVTTKSWEVNEQVTTGFVRATIDTEVGPAALTGNFGVQLVKTKQDSSALAAGVGVVPVKGGDSYSNVLPSLNLSFKFDGDHVVRFGAAREMARARMDEMKAAINYGYNSTFAGSTNINNSPWSGGGGNPKLRPWVADAFDVSYEKYFENKAYVSAALFHKKLKTYIYNQPALYDFTGFTYTGPAPALFQGLVSVPQNGTGGNIKGAELAFSLPGSIFTDALADFGITANASFTDSSIKPNPSDPATPLPGLSETVWNLTAYYEKNGFSARASQRNRSKFLGEVAGFGNGRTLRYVKGESILDLQFGYELQSGPAKGLNLLLQLNNVTDEPFSTYNNGQLQQVVNYQDYGRTILVGASYKL